MKKENNNIKNIAQKAVDGAKKRGIKDVAVSVYRGRKVSVLYRKSRPEKVTESSQLSLGLDLYIDGKYTQCTTNDLREAALEKFLDSSTVLCKAMFRDKFRKITCPSLYKNRQNMDLKLFDKNFVNITPETRHEYARELEKQTIELGGENVISVEAGFDDEQGEIYKAHSNGFEGTKKTTTVSSYSELSLKDKGDKRPSGWSYAVSRFNSNLKEPRYVAKETVEFTKSRIGAQKIETEKMSMLVENRTVGRLLGYLLQALSGRALQQKTTFLEKMEGLKIGSDILDITDDPFVKGGFGSRLFDSEGISAKKMPVFEKGVLRNFYIDTYYGEKMKREPTTGSGSNIIITPGTKNLDELTKNIDKGILVRGFIGGNSNTTTGDFSLGIFGTLIEKGVLTRNVSEMNISGNHKKFWKRLAAAGNDVFTYSSKRVPSLLFDDVLFSGS